VSTLLKALGYSADELLKFFYDVEQVSVSRKKFKKAFNPETMVGQKAPHDLIDAKTGEVVAKKGRKIGKALAQKIVEAGIDAVEIEAADLIGKYTVGAIADPKTGEVIVPGNIELTESLLDDIVNAKVKEFSVLFIDGIKVTARRWRLTR